MSDQIHGAHKLRERLIAFQGMSTGLRWLFWLVAAHSTFVALAIGMSLGHQAQVIIGTSDGQAVQIPTLVFWLLLYSMIIGWTCAISAALLARSAMRYAILALATIVLGFSPLISVNLDSGSGIPLFDSVVRLRWEQLGILGLIWLWALATARRPSIRATSEAETRARVPLGTALGAFALVATYFILDKIVFDMLAGAQTGTNGKEVAGLEFSMQFALLPILLAGVVFYASTSFIDWSNLLGSLAASAAERIGSLKALSALALLLAVGLLLDVARTSGARVLPGLIPTAVLALLIAVVVRFARLSSAWLRQPPVGAVIGSAAFLFAELVLAPIIAEHFVTVNRLSAAAEGSVDGMLGAIFCLLAFTIGLALLAHARATPGSAAGAGGLLLALVALVTGAFRFGAFLAAAGFSVAGLPYVSYDAVKVLVAVIAIGFVLRLPRPRTADQAAPLRVVILALVGIEAVNWFIGINSGRDALGAQPAFAAIFFLVAVLWSLVTSGDVLNRGTPAFPRGVRVLLSLGYTLIASSMLLFFSTRTVVATGQPAPSDLDDSTLALAGMIALGLPLIIYAAVCGVAGWLALRVSPTALAHARVRRHQILAAGGLATLLLLGYTVGIVAPRAIANDYLVASGTGSPAPTSTAFSYYAPAPGQGCDPGAGQWHATTAATCVRGVGLRVAPPAGKIELIDFVLPSRFPADYTASVRVDASALTAGCVSLITRETSDGYGHILCTDGSWQVMGADLARPLASGFVRPGSKVWTLQATALGSQLQFLINGTLVYAGHDTAFTATSRISLEVSNIGPGDGAVVFSQFRLTPAVLSPQPVQPSATPPATPTPTPTSPPTPQAQRLPITLSGTAGGTAFQQPATLLITPSINGQNPVDICLYTSTPFAWATNPAAGVINFDSNSACASSSRYAGQQITLAAISPGSGAGSWIMRAQPSAATYTINGFNTSGGLTATPYLISQGQMSLRVTPGGGVTGNINVTGCASPNACGTSYMATITS